MRPIRLSLIPSFAALLMTGGASYAATPGDLEGNPAAVKSNLMQLACNSCDAKKDKERSRAARAGSTKTRGHNGDWKVTQKKNPSRLSSQTEARQRGGRQFGSQNYGFGPVGCNGCP